MIAYLYSNTKPFEAEMSRKNSLKTLSFATNNDAIFEMFLHLRATGLKNVCACADLGAENPEICFEPSILYSVVYLRLLEEKPRFWSIKTRSDKTSASEA